MTILTLDVENTVTHRGGKMHLDPFEPENTLVMVGLLDEHNNETIVTFDHEDKRPTPNGQFIVQSALDGASVLVGHNITHDLMWLWESGFTYDGPVYDTMLAEYILQRGQKEPLSLDACAKRYVLETQKQDTLKEYFKKGYSTRDIPHEELSEYLSGDLGATRQLFDKLQYRYCNKDKGLQGTLALTNQLCIHLSRMYQRGFSVDLAALEAVRADYEAERSDLQKALTVHTQRLMGDRPINLNSPEQLSWVIFSRKPRDKRSWADTFEKRMSPSLYRGLRDKHSEVLFKQYAKQCKSCSGTGQIRKTKKNGTPYSRTNKCTVCGSSGYIFINRKDVAGLMFSAPSKTWVSANGFGVGKDNLTFLEGIARNRGMTDSEDFLRKVRRLSAVDVYLSSFINGISVFTKADGKLHVRLLQHRTGTGRLSGAEPNMQNMPRGGTFPVKRVFKSRWGGGKILEADFAQLEFRVAAFLSQDAVAVAEVANGFDVHAYTAKVITDAGQPMARQEAKEHTFAPLYGASGFGKTPAEATYYTHFLDKYKGIAKWHAKLADEAVNTTRITTPSGREFSFPYVARKRNGTISYFTQIKNYPVQSFATADIVPLAFIYIDKMLLANKLKSCIVNTVHDSVVIDIHPDEESTVMRIINTTSDNMVPLINTRWGVDFNVPLLLEAKIGPNWLDTKDIV